MIVHAEHILTPSDNRTRGNAAYRTLYKCWYISIFFLPAYHHHLEHHTTDSTSSQHHWPVPGRIRVHHPTSAILDVNTFIPFLTVQKGHVRRVNIQYRVFSWREEEEDDFCLDNPFAWRLTSGEFCFYVFTEYEICIILYKFMVVLIHVG